MIMEYPRRLNHNGTAIMKKLNRLSNFVAFVMRKRTLQICLNEELDLGKNIIERKKN